MPKQGAFVKVVATGGAQGVGGAIPAQRRAGGDSQSSAYPLILLALATPLNYRSIGRGH